MITILFLVILMLSLGGLLGVLMARDPGYVLIAFDGMTIETSLWVGVLLGLVVLGGGLLTWTVVKRVLQSRGAWFRWRREGRRVVSQRRTEEALLLQAEGRWSDALAAYASAADNAELPLANWIHAAEAAHRAGDETTRDELFGRAERAAPRAALALALIKAALQQESSQWASSEQTLLEWVERAPRHPRLNLMRLRAAVALEDWNTVHALLPVLAGSTHLPESERLAVAARAWRARLDEIAVSDIAAEHAQSLWRTVPDEMRTSPAVVARFVEILEEADGTAALIETALRKALDQGLEHSLVLAYARTIADPVQQDEAVSRWLALAGEADPRLRAALLFASARFAEARGEHDVERRLVECIAVFPLIEAKAALGRHLLSVGNAPAARDALSAR